MTPDRRRSIDEIVSRAESRDPSQRSAFVMEACGGDETLRREVEAVLEGVDGRGSHDPVDVGSHAREAPPPRTAPLVSESRQFRHYQLGVLLGAGGMGEVYRARDTRLDRDVAIKVLPSAAVSDPERRSRLAREARMLARLNHPHIGAIYGLEESGDEVALVLELVEGETLADRLARGPVPIAEAIEIARQIAEAVGAAHREGIVHRDLKPANVKLTPDGSVKVLDFGIARAALPCGLKPDATEPTVTSGDTAPGAIVGTAGYMSPEQARGKPVDARTDIWAFGCVLYEMLSGRQPFAADTFSDTIVAILERQPDMTDLPDTTPPSLRTLVRRCLEKDPRRRLQDLGDARIELDELVHARTPHPSAPDRSHGGTRDAGPGGMASANDDPRMDPEPAPEAQQSGARLQSRVRRRLHRAAAIVIVAALAMASGLWWLANRHDQDIRSVAVLPLENLSGDPEQEYFADGMTDQLIADLSKIGTLRVISRTSVMQYKNVRKPLPAIAAELNVDAVVEGSVVRLGDQVRITAKLIRARTEKHLWGKTYQQDVRDVLALQADVARNIATEIDVTLTPQEQVSLARTRTIDPAAHEQVLLGRFHVNKGTEDGFRKAVQAFELAVAMDPENASAHAGLAEAYTMLSSWYMPPREAMPKAKAAAQTALKLDDSNAEAHAALGYAHLIYDWDGPAAKRELVRALQLNPSLAAARVNYAWYLVTQDELEQGVDQIRRAASLDPLSLRIYSEGAMLLMIAGRNDEAIELAGRGLELEKNFGFGLTVQGVAFAEQRRFREALGNVQKAVQLDPSPTIEALSAHVHAVAGEKAAARRLIQQVEEQARHRYFCPYEIGTAYVSLGDNDTAYKWFRQGVEQRADCMAWLGVEPWLEPFRSDPRYPKLLSDVGLAPKPR